MQSTLFVFLCNIENGGKTISPFHDIPLFADADKQIFNMIVEVPRWSNAKFEVCHFICQSFRHLFFSNRSIKVKNSTQSNKMSKKENPGLSQMFSHSMDIFGTTVHFLKYAYFL